MSPNVIVLLPLAGVLLGLASSFAVVNLRPSSRAYSRASYPVVMGFDLKLALLLTLMAMVAFMLAAAGYPLLLRREAPAKPFIPITVGPHGPIVLPQPNTIKTGTPDIPDPGRITKSPTFGIRPVPADQVTEENNLTNDQALNLYSQQTALNDSALKSALLMAESDLPEPGAYVAFDRKPEPVRLVKPVYPAIPAQLRIEGTVYVQMLIDRQGQVVKVLVLRSSGNSALDEAAVEAANNFRFKPAMQGSSPVSVWISTHFDFKMEN